MVLPVNFSFSRFSHWKPAFITFACTYFIKYGRQNVRKSKVQNLCHDVHSWFQHNMMKITNSQSQELSFAINCTTPQTANFKCSAQISCKFQNQRIALTSLKHSSVILFVSLNIPYEGSKVYTSILLIWSNNWKV